MRKIKYTNQFKREKRKRHGLTLDNDLLSVVESLVIDKKLSIKMRDHSLTGDWKDHRDCHIKPDLVLIYRKTKQNTLELVRLGSHSELGF